MATSSDTQDEDDRLISLEDQKVFGAGIKWKRVHFIAASSTSTPVVCIPSTVDAAANKYLSIVLKDSANEISRLQNNAIALSSATFTQPLKRSQPQLCEICRLPVEPHTEDVIDSRLHEASIAHQVCLTHSHPPSHIDRTRSGLKYLSSYGWDPDSRLGLGAAGDGIRTPIKISLKHDTVGLGTERKGGKQTTMRKVQKLDAVKTRKEEKSQRRMGDRLREIFYRNDDVERYLGGD